MSAPRPSRGPETASQQLSQGDIDQMMMGGAVATSTPIAARSDIQLYDFRRPHRVSKDRLHVLGAPRSYHRDGRAGVRIQRPVLAVGSDDVRIGDDGVGGQVGDEARQRGVHPASLGAARRRATAP